MAAGVERYLMCEREGEERDEEEEEEEREMVSVHSSNWGGRGGGEGACPPLGPPPPRPSPETDWQCFSIEGLTLCVGGHSWKDRYDCSEHRTL